MNTNIVEVRQHELIQFTLDNTAGPRTFSLYLPFQPDEVVLKSVLYYSVTSDSARPMTFIRTNFIKNSSSTICYFYSTGSAVTAADGQPMETGDSSADTVAGLFYCPNLHFKVISPIPNQLSFNFIDPTGAYEVGR